MAQQSLSAFWSISSDDLLAQLESSPQGLSPGEAQRRLARLGANLLRAKGRTDSVTLLLAQYKSPIILILVFACLLSFALGDKADALIILAIVLVSGLLGFWQERGATNAVAKLLAIVQIKATVRRQGEPQETMVLPYTPVAKLFGFRPLSLEFLGVIGLIMVLYITSAELAKKVFYRFNRR